MISGRDVSPPPKWYRLPRWFRATLQGLISTGDWDTERDEERFLDLNQLIIALFAQLPEAKVKVQDLIHMQVQAGRQEPLRAACRGDRRGSQTRSFVMKLIFFQRRHFYVRPEEAGPDCAVQLPRYLEYR